MRKTEIDTNEVVIAGIITNLEYGFTCSGERFQKGTIKVERISGTIDEVPVVISERILDKTIDCKEKFAEIKGNLRVYTDKTNRKKLLYVFVSEVFIPEYGAWNCNAVSLTGYICKDVHLRKTPISERDIADVLIACNYRYGKTFYIPCILWGRNAKYVSELPIGTKLEMRGRFQSREYNKRIGEKEYEIRTAYEISVKEMIEVEADDKD